MRVAGDADRYDHRDGNNDCTQPGNLFRLMTSEQRRRLANNIAASMRGVPAFIIDRQLGHFDKADPTYGEEVRTALREADIAFGTTR